MQIKQKEALVLIRKNLQELVIPATYENMDKLIVCLTLINKMIDQLNRQEEVEQHDAD